MLSEALRLIRVFHDMKQSDLATRLGISNSYLSEIESGKKTPKMEVLERYSTEFEIPMSSILFFSESINHPNDSLKAVAKSRGVIAKKIINFLQLIERKTAHV